MKSYFIICMVYLIILLNIILPVFCFISNGKYSSNDQRLFTAIKTGNLKVVQRLIEYSDVNTVDEKGDSPLHWAARWDNKNVVDLKIKTDVSSSSRAFGNLYFTTSTSKRYIADLFAKVGWKVSQRKHGGKKIVELLVDNGANVNLQNRAGKTALHEAAHWGNERIVEFLINNGANVNTNAYDGNTALHDAALNGNERIVRMLIRKGADVNRLDIKLKSPLHWAVAAGNKKVVELLIENGADIDLVDDDGDTVLFTAIEGGLDDIAETLIKEGANVGIANAKNGRTTLHWAAQRGNLKLVNLLIANGIDVDVEDKNGTTAMELARKYDHKDIMNLLSQHTKNTKENEDDDDNSFIPIKRSEDGSA